VNQRATAQPQKTASPGNVSAHAGLLQRKCACGGVAGLTGQCAECRGGRFTIQRPAATQAETLTAPQELSTGKPLELGAEGNSLERQAEELADRAMRIPGSGPAVNFSPASGEAGTEGTLPAEIAEQINQATSGGESLDRSEQEFFAPKFGHDFGKVHVHRDAAAASLARRLNASAFTVGSHVFFNAGVYQPRSEGGRRLLAHELAHVVQQERGLVSRHVQRASISYRQLTWADFTGSAPANPPFSALTSSGFDIPVWKPKRDITDTKEACEVGKKKSTKHTATVSVDPADFDTVKAKMVQENSWVLSKYKDPDKHCPTVKDQCEKEIDTQATAASKLCKQEVKPCQDVFDQGSTRYTNKVDGTEITATSKEECSTKLVSDCEKALAKNQKFEVKEKCDGAVVVNATSKADCSSKKFKEDCLKYYKDWSARLLKHEQGHFDISNVIAGNALADLKTKAATFTATATECGRAQANNAAVKKFDALNAPTELAKRGQDWIDLKDKAEKDYDDQTDHGCKQSPQATWDKDIAAGLKTYDLNKAVAPTTPSSQPKQTNAPANPGGSAGSADLE
jgi:hypothetical protein